MGMKFFIHSCPGTTIMRSKISLLGITPRIVCCAYVLPGSENCVKSSETIKKNSTVYELALKTGLSFIQI